MHCIPFLFLHISNMSTKALYGLIGYPLEHSFSPGYFNDKFRRENIDAIYRAFPIHFTNEYKQLLLAHPHLSGLNVTIPYKQEIIALLDDIDKDAAIVKAVNCIRFVEGKSIGYNTDIIGFAKSLSPLLQPYMNKALVLGSGGSSKAVQFVLNQLCIEYLIVSREKKQGCITYKDLNTGLINEHLLIINTTPLGMYPNIEACPELPYEAITDKHLLYDLIYNPALTKFLQMGQQYGATIKNGQDMLELQAEASWAIWNL